MPCGTHSLPSQTHENNNTRRGTGTCGHTRCGTQSGHQLGLRILRKARPETGRLTQAAINPTIPHTAPQQGGTRGVEKSDGPPVYPPAPKTGARPSEIDDDGRGGHWVALDPTRPHGRRRWLWAACLPCRQVGVVAGKVHSLLATTEHVLLAVL